MLATSREGPGFEAAGACLALSSSRSSFSITVRASPSSLFKRVIVAAFSLLEVAASLASARAASRSLMLAPSREGPRL